MDAAATTTRSEKEFVRRRFSPQLHRLFSAQEAQIKKLQEQVRELVVEPAAVTGDEPLRLAFLNLSPSTFGDFEVFHGLDVEPKAVIIEMTSSGLIWLQTGKYDDEKIYLVASDTGVTADAKILY